MIVYANGDSHTAGTDAGGLNFSYAKLLADKLNATIINESKAGGSNARIIRTTNEYLKNNKPDIIIIGWTTWEREEWFHQGRYYNVNSSGSDVLPKNLSQAYKDWVLNTAHNYQENEYKSHQMIWEFHSELKLSGIPHIFFNTYQYFFNAVAYQMPKFDWGENFISPYDQDFTYYHWLQNQGFKTVSPENYHYGADAQTAWADYLYLHLTKTLKDSIITK